MHRHPGSFRDPAGYVLRDGDGVIRTIHRSYQREYDRLVQSGLYDALSSTGRLISHEEISDHGLDAYKVIRPRQIPFVSYPYEWSFGQLRDGALLMLECLAVALDHGMWLKDASAFNVQFSGTSPVLIDTLSFASSLKVGPGPATDNSASISWRRWHWQASATRGSSHHRSSIWTEFHSIWRRACFHSELGSRSG